MTRLRSNSGQAAVLTVVFLAALLGAVALVLDVGGWFRAQRATQSAADAAALAAAQALPESTGTATTVRVAVPDRERRRDQRVLVLHQERRQ